MHNNRFMPPSRWRAHHEVVPAQTYRGLCGVLGCNGAAAALPVVPETALYPLHGNSHSSSPATAAEPASQPLVSLKTFLREQEQSYLNRVLQQCGGDKERAAIELGVSLATLYRKISGEEKD